MHFKAENLTIPKHPRLLFLAQNLGVLRPSKSWGHFFWDTLYYQLNFWWTFTAIWFISNLPDDEDLDPAQSRSCLCLCCSVSSFSFPTFLAVTKSLSQVSLSLKINSSENLAVFIYIFMMILLFQQEGFNRSALLNTALHYYLRAGMLKNWFKRR